MHHSFDPHLYRVEESRAKRCDNACIFACLPVVGEGVYLEFAVKHSRVITIGVFPQGSAYTVKPVLSGHSKRNQRLITA